MPFDAGALRHEVTFQTVARVPNGEGGTQETWSDLTTVRMERRGFTGSEVIKAAKIDPNKTYRFWGRYISTVTEDCRIIHNSTIFDILHIAPGNKNRYMEVIAKDTGRAA